MHTITGNSRNTIVAAAITTLTILSLLFFSPAKASAVGPCVVKEDGTGGMLTFNLLAGQSIVAGMVSVVVDGDSLKVTYQTIDGWKLSEAHLWIGNEIADLPQTKTGNPVPGQFPYKSGPLDTDFYQFSIPLTNPALNFSCPSPDVIYYMAAHASVRKANGDGTFQTETGWSAGSPITSRGNWATFSTFTLTCNCGGSSDAVCETAFAKSSSSSTCFLNIDPQIQRWGWSNGPLGPGTYTFDIYAGAGQCDTSKGALAGTLTVIYNGSLATVTFNTTGGWFMNETHLYVGNNPLPQFKQGNKTVNTVAPGQYPYIHTDLNKATTDSYTVKISGNIYVVAHAVACK